MVSLGVAALAPTLAAADPAPVNVTVRTDGEALARGFADAFETLPGGVAYLTYMREDKGFVTISGIRSVRAMGAVLLIRTDRGPMLALPARSIVVITDERPVGP